MLGGASPASVPTLFLSHPRLTCPPWGAWGVALVSLHHLPSHHRASEGDAGVQGDQPRAGGEKSRMFSPFS